MSINFLSCDQAASLVINDLYPSAFATDTTNFTGTGGTVFPEPGFVSSPVYYYWEWWKPVQHNHTHYHYEELRPELKEFSKKLVIGDGMPRINLFFDKKAAAFVVEAAICGIPKEEVHVVIDNGYLKFEFAGAIQDESIEYLTQELSRGAFLRKVKVPETADMEKVETSYKDGVMRITMPIKKDKYKELTF